jgi:hypothetical protein
MIEILMKGYAVILGLLVLLNASAWLRFRGKLWFLAYEFISMGYFIFLIFAYYSETLNAAMPYWALLPVIVFIGVDVWFTTRSDMKQLCPGIPDEDLPEGTLDTAMALSIVFNGPAYVLACMFLFEKLT